MAKMTHDDARNLCAQFGIIRHPELPDWHRLDSDQKERVLAAADAWRYRKPGRANGSRGRYFCEYLRRAIQQDKG